MLGRRVDVFGEASIHGILTPSFPVRRGNALFFSSDVNKNPHSMNSRFCSQSLPATPFKYFVLFIIMFMFIISVSVSRIWQGEDSSHARLDDRRGPQGVNHEQDEVQGQNL